MDNNKKQKDNSMTGFVPFLVGVFLIGGTVLTYHLDNYFSESIINGLHFFIVGGLILASAFRIYKWLHKEVVKNSSYLTEKENEFHTFKARINQQPYPFYDKNGQLIFIPVDVFVFEKIDADVRFFKTRKHYPDLILKPVVQNRNALFNESEPVKLAFNEAQDADKINTLQPMNGLYLWNDAVVEPLDFSRYRTVKEWLIDKNYDVFNVKIEDEFKQKFKRHNESSSFRDYGLTFDTFPWAPLTIFGILSLFSSLVGFMLFLTFGFFIWGVFWIMHKDTYNKQYPKNPVFKKQFLNQFKDFEASVKTFDFAQLGRLGESVLYINFVNKKERDAQSISPLNPVAFRYIPIAEKTENRVQFSFKISNDMERDKERGFQKFIGEHNIDYLNLTPQQHHQLKQFQ